MPRSSLLGLVAAQLVFCGLLAGCTCGSTAPGGTGSSSAEPQTQLSSIAERAQLVPLDEEIEEEPESDTDVEWPSEPGPTVVPVPPPNLELAGGEQCKLSGPHLIGEHPRPDRDWHKSVQIGFGADGGLVAYTFGQTTAYLRPVDAKGVPRGEAAPFVQDVEARFSYILAHSKGFLVIGSDDNAYDHQLLWVTDAAGRRPQARAKLPLPKMGTLARSDVVGDRLLLAARDKWGIRVVLVQVNADGTVDFPVYVEHLIVDVQHKSVSAEVALSEEHGVILFIEEALGEEGRLYEYLFWDGEKRELAGEVPVPVILVHDHQTHRLAWHQGQLHILSDVEDPDDASPPLIMTNPAGERVIEQGIDDVLRFRYGVFESNWFKHGEPIEQPARAELEPPFVQRVVLDVGAAQISRMTQLGLVTVGEPADLAALEPPIGDPLYAKWAWSGTHFVVAYPVFTADKVAVHTFALECKK